ncbi:MAG TPA: dienelactone hydrolase family protein [Microlunatus sp.]|nr:dienelactone hydrolase family protein [Microlunatus sp.]
MTGTRITVPAPAATDSDGATHDDEQFQAYLAVPDGEVKGGIVVIHEVWGMQDHFRDIADQFSAAFYGSLDDALVASLPQLEADTAAAGLDFRAVVYEGAKHAFFNDTNASTYDEAAATDSWQQSTAFLERQLG